MKSTKIFFNLSLFMLLTASTLSAQWQTSGTKIYYNDGNVGIGATNPLSKLQLDASTGADPLRVRIGGSTKFYVRSNGGTAIGAYSSAPDNGLYVAGNVGIGTSDTNGKLAIQNVGGSDGINLLTFSENTDSEFYFEGNFAGTGAGGNNLALKTYWGDNAMTWRGDGHVGIGMENPGDYRLAVNGDVSFLGNLFSLGGTGNYVDFYAVAGNGLKISSSKVHIGSNGTTPSGYSFSVDGKVICEELTVQLSGDWPDYVFEEDYALASLEDLEKSIQEYKHLPGIPSATEVEEKGISLGEMQTKMMEKIEELTLYVIELNKENSLLKERISSLEK